MHPRIRFPSVWTACAAVTLAGCATSSRQVSPDSVPATATAPSAAPATGTSSTAAASPGGSDALLRAMVGTWDGRSRPTTGADTTSGAFRLELTAARTGWVLSFPDDTTHQRVPGRVVAAEGDSVVMMWGPYNAPVGAQMQNVVTHSVARLDGGKMVGTYDLRPASAPDSVVGRGRFEATRVP